MSDRDEGALVRRAQGGDLDAYEQLVRGHTDQLYTVILRVVGNRQDAEDIAQETLLRGWRAIGSFRGGARFSTWMSRIATNETNRFLERSARRRGQQSVEEQEDHLASPTDQQPAARAELHALQDALRLAVAQLPMKLRVALELRDVEGLSTSEAAAVVGIREAAFKTRLHQARMKVRSTLGDAALLA